MWIERHMRLKSENLFFSTMPGHDQHTLTQDKDIFFLYTLYKLNGSMFYLVLGLCTPKITSNRVHLDKKNGLATTRGIESGPLLREPILFFKLKNNCWI